MGFREKVRAAHKKLENEREAKMQMYAAAMNALRWWEQTNGRADAAISRGLEAGERISRGRVTFTEWLKYSPFRWLRTLGYKVSRGISPLKLELAVAHEATEVWRVAVILGGKHTLDAKAIAKETDLSEVRVAAILKQLNEEARTERKAQIDAEIKRLEATRTIH